MRQSISIKSLLILSILVISQSSCNLFNLDEDETVDQVVQVEQGPTKIRVESSFGGLVGVGTLMYDENGYVEQLLLHEEGGQETLLHSAIRTSASTIEMGTPGDLLEHSIENNRITGYDNGNTKLSIQYDENRNITEVKKENHTDSGLSPVLVHQFGYNDENQMHGMQGYHNTSNRSFSVSASRVEFSTFDNPIYEIRDLWITAIASYANHEEYAMAFSPKLYTEMQTDWTSPQEERISTVEDIEIENGRVVGFSAPGIFGSRVSYTFEYN